MPDRGQISVQQFIILVTIITIGDNLLVLPSGVALEAHQDAWLSSLLGLAIGMIAVYLMGTTSRLYAGLTFVQCNRNVLGKWAGTAITLFFLIFPFLSDVAHIREIGDFMTTQSLTETPIEAIHLLFLIIIILGARLGVETMARAGEVFFPWIILFLLVLVIFLLPQIKWEFMLPVMEDGIKPVIRGSITASTFPFMELAGFMMIFPYIDREKEIRKHFIWGASLGGVVLVVIIFLSILVLGADLTERHLYPSYAMARKINIGRFLQRLEAVLAFMWIITTFLKAAFHFYILSLGFAQVFKLKDYRALTLPFGMIMFVFTMVITPNIVYYNEVISKYWPFFDFTYGVLLPLLLLGAYAVRKGKPA